MINNFVTVDVVNNSINDLPFYAKLGDAGVDLKADFSKGVKEEFFYGANYDPLRNVIIMWPGSRALIPTNLHTAIPAGYEVQIRPRSGLALKNGITVLNTPGTIDAGYRNSWGVILINLCDDIFEISQGDRIAQAVLHKFETIKWNNVDKLPDSARGMDGYGSTGVKES